jgi:hypothetical protein
MKKLPRKRRTREHVIADLSVNYVERHALHCGFVVERVGHDYGVDLELFTFNQKGEIEEGKILLQLKASDRLPIRANQPAFSLRIDRRDLVLWLAQPMPVLLIVYDVRKEVAYWLYIQSHFRRLKDFNLFTAGTRVTVRIPVANVVTPTAKRRFARFRDAVLEQMRKVIHDEGYAHHLCGAAALPERAGLRRHPCGGRLDS